MASSGTVTSGEYIKHHLTNLTYGPKSDGSWAFAQSGDEAAEMGFWAVNVDSLFWSFTLGALFLLFFARVAKKITTAEPGTAQGFVEMVIEFIDENVNNY